MLTTHGQTRPLLEWLSMEPNLRGWVVHGFEGVLGVSISWAARKTRKSTDGAVKYGPVIFNAFKGCSDTNAAIASR